MLSNKIQKKIVKLMELALKVNSRDENCIFISFSGHCECINIQIHKNGWIAEEEADYRKDIYHLNSDIEILKKESEKALDETILEIEELV